MSCFLNEYNTFDKYVDFFAWFCIYVFVIYDTIIDYMMIIVVKVSF